MSGDGEIGVSAEVERADLPRPCLFVLLGPLTDGVTLVHAADGRAAEAHLFGSRSHSHTQK